MVLPSSYDQKCARYLLVLKSNVTLARSFHKKTFCNCLHGNSRQVVGACIFMPKNKTLGPMWMDGLIHRKQLLNLFYIVYNQSNEI